MNIIINDKKASEKFICEACRLLGKAELLMNSEVNKALEKNYSHVNSKFDTRVICRKCQAKRQEKVFCTADFFSVYS